MTHDEIQQFTHLQNEVRELKQRMNDSVRFWNEFDELRDAHNALCDVVGDLVCTIKCDAGFTYDKVLDGITNARLTQQEDTVNYPMVRVDPKTGDMGIGTPPPERLTIEPSGSGAVGVTPTQKLEAQDEPQDSTNETDAESRPRTVLEVECVAVGDASLELDAKLSALSDKLDTYTYPLCSLDVKETVEKLVRPILEQYEAQIEALTQQLEYTDIERGTYKHSAQDSEGNE